MSASIKSTVLETLNRLEDGRIDDLHGVRPSSVSTTDSVSGGSDESANGALMENGRTREDKQLVSDVLVDLERMIVSDDWLSAQTNGEKEAPVEKGRSKKFLLPALDQLGRSVVTSYSLKHYVKLLAPHHRTGVANFLYSHASATLSKLFRFPQATVLFHSEQFDGLLRVVRVALHSRYANLVQTGYQQFREHPPVIYVSANVGYGGIEQFLSFELGLCDIRTIPARKSGPTVRETMDCDALREQLESDTRDSRIPVLVIASAGSHVLGRCDDFDVLATLKEEFNFWLHLDGLQLASLALPEIAVGGPKKLLQSMREQADSFFIPLGYWLGVPAVPYISMHRSVEFIRPNHAEKLSALPWWVVTKHLGPQGIVERIQHSLNLTKAIMKGVEKYPQMKILHASDDDAAALSEKSSPPVLLFKYVFPPDVKRVSAAALEGMSAEESKHLTDAFERLFDEQYLDALNTWIGQGLCADCRHLGLQLVSLHDVGVCTRYCALENACALKTSSEHVMKFSKQLETTMSIVEATVRARARCAETLLGAASAGLLQVDVHKWAGVGAVVYVPSMLRSLQAWEEKQREQVSHLNIELVHILRSNDHAFSLGETTDGVQCVKFGMLANADDLDDLVALVSKVGREIEESSKYIESMAELVRQGIEAANEELKRETDTRLMNEGVLRQVPLVGSLLNWWSPLPRESTTLCGRSFDLVTGQINATESVYKRHILLNRGASIESPPATPAQLHSTPLPGEERDLSAGESGEHEHDDEGESSENDEEVRAEEAGGRVPNGVAPVKE